MSCPFNLFLLVLALPLRSVGLPLLGANDASGPQALTKAASVSTRRLMHSRAHKMASKYCNKGDFVDLYDTITRDLQHWRRSGITAQLMDWTLSEVFTDSTRCKGAGILFKGGKPYIITDTALLETVGHHKRLVAAHFALFLALSAAFGTSIPDVEFVFSTADAPSVYLGSRPAPPANVSKAVRRWIAPVLSFCKSKHSHADILIPDIHFFLRNFTSRLLNETEKFNTRWPWARKTPVLFGRFAPYPRAVDIAAPELYRKGKGGADICRAASPMLLFCDVRKHYVLQWAPGANRSGLPVDVAQQPKRDYLYHASHKWLLHLDGATCSSRLEQLLALGSLVVKEESGYVAFFHHLIHPYKHYVPVWKEVPEETKDVVLWAKEHDQEAAEIAAAAQQLARRYLHKRAIMCYWLRLLQELSPLLRYKPGREEGARAYPHLKPVEDYMQAEGWAELEKYKYRHMEFWE